ncbi:MAG: RluA family pseudouridine synthase [Spirochaetaceae bacterium]|nr:RluA family pseudouridine synthase [Spirochaetaceae bacterium]
MPDAGITVAEGFDGMRLDQYISGGLGLLSRSQIKARKLEALLDGRPVKLSRQVKSGDCFFLRWEEAETPFLVPEDIPLDILYEDDELVVINKKQGMAVHPGAGRSGGTLANALLFRMGREQSAALRPGIVHRLDKDTSGVIIAAYNEKAHAFLSAQFKERSAKKHYLALTQGGPPCAGGSVETYISRDSGDRKKFTVSETRGKKALTRYRVLKSWTLGGRNYSLLSLRPRTGRTHQIRVHLKYLRCPILGDPLYGGKDKNFPHASLMLHARQLRITTPGGKLMSFKAPLPGAFLDLLQELDEKDRSPGP